MVALRDICQDEEICISYVPNGDLDAGNDDNEDLFQHFGPTRTYEWLNRHSTTTSDASPIRSDGVVDPETNPKGIVELSKDADPNALGIAAEPSAGLQEEEARSTTSSKNYDAEVGTQDDDSNDEDEDEDLQPQGFNHADRVQGISEYGFECRCYRCQAEKKGLVYERSDKTSNI
jgi:hypothetical protein